MKFLIAILVCLPVLGSSVTLKLGGVFNSLIEREVFKFAVSENKFPDLIVEEYEMVNSSDSHQNNCSSLKNAVIEKIDSRSIIPRLICQLPGCFKVPYVRNSSDTEKFFSTYFYKDLLPNIGFISDAYLDLMNALSWNDIFVLYENEEYGPFMILNNQSSNERSEDNCNKSCGSYKSSNSILPLLSSGSKNIVIDGLRNWTEATLMKLKNANLFRKDYSYILTSVESSEINFDPEEATFYFYRMVDRETELAEEVSKKWALSPDHEGIDILNLENALTYDAVKLFMTVLKEVDKKEKCVRATFPNTWVDGFKGLFKLQKWEMNGLTGKIKFDGYGSRVNMAIDIIRKSSSGSAKYGTYSFANKLEIYKRKESGSPLIITAVMGSPYLMLKEEADKLGNEKYEGFAVDFAKELCRMMMRDFEIYPTADGKYGSMNKKSGKWNGMIGEILEEKADISISDLTMTEERKKAVRFSIPFMNSGISILHYRNGLSYFDAFFFTEPFFMDTWIYIFISSVGVAFLLFLLSKISPAEKYGASTSNSGFSFLNSICYALSALFLQRTNTVPKALSTSIVTGTWCFFSLLVALAFIRNSALYLISQKMNAPIQSVEDLVHRNIKYGALHGGSTSQYFRDSNYQIYQRIWANMAASDPSNFFTSNTEGVEKVKEGKGEYAAFMESNIIDFVTAKDHELRQVGGLLNLKPFGVAMRHDFELAEQIDVAISKLKKDGKLKALKDKWWDIKESVTYYEEFDVNKYYAVLDGAFLILILGMLLGTIIALLEYGLETWTRMKRKASDNESALKIIKL